MTAYTLRPWTDVAVPHEDIRSGELAMATYAADLGAVVRGDPQCPRVYRDAGAFYDATYLTAALRSILRDALHVLAGGAGDRVLQLRTPFGGGKTHTLVALYHLARSRAALAGRPDLAGLPDPGPVRVAVLSGVDLDPRAGRRVEGGPHLRTLWGELAWQLGGAEAYSQVQEQDEGRSAPGGDVLRQLLDGSPTLVLLDEVLIYVETAKAIPLGDSTLGRQMMVFLQRLTEVVRGLRRAAMVYSLQASVHEAGRDEALLADLDHLVSRIDSKREPVSGDEVMRVVQRRLFERLGDEATRRAVVAEYAALYRRLREATAETGPEREGAAREAEALERRIEASYPVHPDLLDLMYLRWGGLPSYQRTRGALQFLACVVHAQWQEQGSAQPLIGPGDVLLGDPAVRNALFAQVGGREQYNSVLDADITGGRPRARAVDERVGRDSPALRGLRLGSRLATAAFLYSFGARNGEARGVVEAELTAACLAPGLDRTVLVAALSDLREELLYLHHTGRRYRFEPQPNLNKLIADEAVKYGADEIRRELEKRLAGEIRATRGVVLWPGDAAQVPDGEPVFTVVYLPLEWAERAEAEIQAHVRSLLDSRAGGKREYQNALAFAVPARQPADLARGAVRTLLAIEELKRQKARHNFSAEQLEELEEKRRRADDDLAGGLRRLYEVVLLPVAAETGPEALRLEPVDLRAQLSGGRAIQERVLDGLRRWVHADVRAHRIVSLTRLGQPTGAGGLEYVPAEQLLEWFFGVLDFPKLLDDAGLKKGIAEGVASGQLGYVPAARPDGPGGLVVDTPALVRLGESVRPEEIDLSRGAYVLAPGLATRLRPPIGRVEPSAPPPPAAEGPAPPPASPGQAATRYVLDATASKAQVFKVFTALQHLSDRSRAMRVVVHIEADAQDQFDPVWLRNAVEEPLDEGGIPRQGGLEA